MARQLWLLRHADAEPHGTRPDSQRRLTPRGERQAHAVGKALARAELELELTGVLVSPKVRARQTAELAAEHWGKEQRALIHVHEPLAEGFDAARALAALADIDANGRLMLVGHEPDLSRLAGELTGARIDLKKGGLAICRVEGDAAADRPAGRSPLSSRTSLSSQSDGPGGELVLLLRPRELALIAHGVELADV
jgi:phosphohistidine phosphatase